MTEPDITITFKGGPNDGGRLEIHGGPSATLYSPLTAGIYRLDQAKWADEKLAVYNWKPFTDQDDD